MGWQSYVISYETAEQLETLLDLCKLHNSSPCDTNIFFRFHTDRPYEQIKVGEDIVGVCTTTLKKPYKRPRDGPSMEKAILFGNGGGRHCTFGFFAYHLQRLKEFGWPHLNVYPFEMAMQKRFGDPVRIPDERVMGQCESDWEYVVRPALMVTQKFEVGSCSFEEIEDGYVVQDRRFADLAEAEAFVVERKAEMARCREQMRERIEQGPGESDADRTMRGIMETLDEEGKNDAVTTYLIDTQALSIEDAMTESRRMANDDPDKFKVVLHDAIMSTIPDCDKRPISSPQ